MNLDGVEKHFDVDAPDYDRTITSIIPGYRAQNEVMLGLMPADRALALETLDLGCGTGSLSRLTLEAFPNARVLALDLSQKMLDEMARTLGAKAARVRTLKADFSRAGLGSGVFDWVWCGLALHHLEDEGKRRLIGRVFEALKPGGTFMIRDIVLGDTPELTQKYLGLWRAFMRGNGLNDAEWFGVYEREDIPATVGRHLEWMAQAGFGQTACHWRYLNFAVMSGVRPVF